MSAPPGEGVPAARARLAAIVATLLAETASERDQIAAVRAWHDWAMAELATPADDASERACELASGRAIGPAEAARCVLDHRRTAAFLRAVDGALREMAERFPDEAIHLVEAGCGPLAALSLPFALHHPPERLRITLLDAHEAGLEGARRLARALGVEASLHRTVCGDAAEHRFPADERPHVVACEVLQRALADEPQVAVTRALAPQVRPGGCFVPARIDVRLALFDAAEHFNAARAAPGGVADRTRGLRDLGLAYRLEAAGDAAPAAELAVPRHDRRRERLHLLTRIELHGGVGLGDFDCALNQPEPLEHPPEIAAAGGTVRFRYRPGGRPGLAAEFAVASGDAAETIGDPAGSSVPQPPPPPCA